MSEPAVSYEWNPIEDLPGDWHSIARPDLDELLRVWSQERASLKDPSKVGRLEERLATLWAIETGVIEKLYTIDRGTTETLVNLGLDAIHQFSTTGRISQQAGKLIEDQRAALDFVFSYLKEERPLSISYIKELHQLLLRNQDFTEAIDQFGNRFRTDLVRGDWKKLSNNPLTPNGTIHEYCPSDFVQDEMEALLRMHLSHDAAGVRPEVEAAWLHHRFTQIHPFQDGNGRVARALATMAFLKAGFLPLVIRDQQHREAYLQALKRADEGELGSLVSLFANIQTTDLQDAITFLREMRGEGIRDIAAAAANAAQRRMQQDEERLTNMTERFASVAKYRLDEVAHELHEAFAEANVVLHADVWRNSDENQHWWSHQIVDAARAYRYFADLGRFRRWVQLRLVAAVAVPRSNIVVSFHHKESRAGLMASVIFLTTSELGSEEASPTTVGSANEFTYSSSSRVSDEDFREWLEEALRSILDAWQSRI